MTDFHLDYETYSAADIRSVGAYRYAADPSAEVLILAIARGSEAPVPWVPERWRGCLDIDCDPAEELLEEMCGTKGLIYAHNAEFETAVTAYCWPKELQHLKKPRLERWRCTAAMARRAALPAKLADISAYFKLGDKAKDKAGSALIRIFSVPNKKTGARVLPSDRPDKFQEFINYCVQDVVAEQEVHRRLLPFAVTGACEEAFLLHARMNYRGLPVNVSALRNAQELVEEIEEKLGARFSEVTGGLAPAQVKALVPWLQKRGYPADNMQAATVEAALKDTSWAKSQKAIDALELRQQLAFSAVKKVKSMLDCECGDGKVRGTLQYYGAGTGRSAGRLVQPQNFKRPSFKDTALSYQMIQEGTTLEELDLLYGNPMEAIASSIRHFIQLPGGDKILNADYAGIEARIVCWLADQLDALREFREYDAGRGPNAYELMASSIFEMPLKSISKDGIERFIGKQTVLGCGFGMGAPKFADTCANYGQVIPLELAEKAVGIFRQVRSRVVKLWGKCESAARAAINDPETWYPAGSKIRFAVTDAGDTRFLVMRLPSGRNIVYPEPALEKSPRNGKLQITFHGQVPHKSIWGRVSTYGGKLVENATQGTAADVMFNGACKAEKADFRIITLIHDEALSRPRSTDYDSELKEFMKCLCDLPDWAEDLPIVADGKVVPYYLK
jgi:DNA polymerase